MNWFARNVLLIHVLVLVVALGWIHGGTRAELLVPVVPWLALMILEWLLVFPQARNAESLADSRERVWRALVRDPLTYLTLVLGTLLAIPLFNVAAPPVFDAAAQQWSIPAPPFKGLPYCVNPDQHAVLLLWFLPVCVAALAVKHGLLKKSKRILLEAVCWNGAALAVLGFVQLGTGTTDLLWLTPMKSYFFSSFGYPNFAGAYFTLTAALSYGLWFQSFTEAKGLAAVDTGMADRESTLAVTHRLLLPAAFCFVAAFASLSRAAILLSVLVFASMSLLMVLAVWSRLQTSARVIVLCSLFAVTVGGGASVLVLRFDSLRNEIREITLSAVVERVTGKNHYHARVARAIIGDYPYFGIGGWGYPRYQPAYLTPEEEKRMQIEGGANVHNDALQFLAEQGFVGFGLLVAIALTLGLPLLWQAWRLGRSASAPQEASTVGIIQPPDSFLGRIPAPLIGVWAGTTATLCHAMGDLPFRSPAVLIIWMMAFACAPGWLPTLRRRS